MATWGRDLKRAAKSPIVKSAAKGTMGGAMAGAAVGARGANKMMKGNVYTTRGAHQAARGGYMMVGGAAMVGGSVGMGAGIAKGLYNAHHNTSSSNSGHEGHFHSAKNMSGAHHF